MELSKGKSRDGTIHVNNDITTTEQALAEEYTIRQWKKFVTLRGKMFQGKRVEKRYQGKNALEKANLMKIELVKTQLQVK